MSLFETKAELNTGSLNDIASFMDEVFLKDLPTTMKWGTDIILDNGIRIRIDTASGRNIIYRVGNTDNFCPDDGLPSNEVKNVYTHFSADGNTRYFRDEETEKTIILTKDNNDNWVYLTNNYLITENDIYQLNINPSVGSNELFTLSSIVPTTAGIELPYIYKVDSAPGFFPNTFVTLNGKTYRLVSSKNADNVGTLTIAFEVSKDGD